MNTSRQLNDLIKNISKKTGVNAQILQKRYFMERFLERLSKSRFRDKFILKGGALISALVGVYARTTMDIDITLKSLLLNADTIKTIMLEILSLDLNDDIKYSLKKIENIHEEAEYDCYRVSLDIAFDKVCESIKIDITTGDVISPKEIQFGYATMLDNRKITLYAYNIETILAEKLETVLTRSVLNTRMRDYYDCYILNKLYGDSISPSTLKIALEATAKKRKSESIFTNPEKIIKEIKASQDMQKLWKAYSSTYHYAKEITFEDTVETVEKYIEVLGFKKGENKQKVESKK